MSDAGFFLQRYACFRGSHERSRLRPPIIFSPGTAFPLPIRALFLFSFFFSAIPTEIYFAVFALRSMSLRIMVTCDMSGERRRNGKKESIPLKANWRRRRRKLILIVLSFRSSIFSPLRRKLKVVSSLDGSQTIPAKCLLF